MLCCVLSHVRLFVTPWTVAHQAPLSMEFYILYIATQFSCLENSMERRSWWATVHGVAKSWTRLK